jgi:chemotaxis protein MotB
MAGSKGRFILGAAAAALVGASQGCVSLNAYEEAREREKALIHAYQGANTLVGNYKQKLDEAHARIREMNGQVEQAAGRVQAANAAIDQERPKLQSDYQRMLEELRAEGSGAFVINQSTGGIVLSNDIFFSPGKAELKPESLASLDALIAKLEEPRFQGARFEVAGHTDEDPITHSGWKDNYQLSAERARAVLLHFVKRGVDPKRAYLSGYGPTRPRSQEKSENRRVEIVLHEGA